MTCPGNLLARGQRHQLQVPDNLKCSKPCAGAQTGASFKKTKLIVIISWDRDRENPLVSMSCKLGWWYSDVPRMGVMQKFKSHLKEKTNQNQKSGYSFSLPGLSYCLLALTQALQGRDIIPTIAGKRSTPGSTKSDNKWDCSSNLTPGQSVDRDSSGKEGDAGSSASFPCGGCQSPCWAGAAGK